jgi:L-asparagine transporter-like permease
VFDRIREFLELHHAKTDDPKEVINNAINSTLSRTIITALTVLFVLIVLFIFGGDVIVASHSRYYRCMFRYLFVDLCSYTGYYRLWKERPEIINK